jgi:hypothetical protein
MSGKMTQADAARIQSSNVSSNHPIPPLHYALCTDSVKAKSGNDSGFASRAQSAGDRNANAGSTGNSGNTGNSGSNNASGKK